MGPDSLPPSVRETVRNAVQVEAAPLSIVPADEAEAETLADSGAEAAGTPSGEVETGRGTGPDRIAGYPRSGSLRVIAEEPRRALILVLLDQGSYRGPPVAPGRCRNETMLGARFHPPASAEGMVELALGVECRQAIWAFRSEGQVRRWGGILTEGAASRVAEILRR